MTTGVGMGVQGVLVTTSDRFHTTVRRPPFLPACPRLLPPCQEAHFIKHREAKGAQKGTLAHVGKHAAKGGLSGSVDDGEIRAGFVPNG